MVSRADQWLARFVCICIVMIHTLFISVGFVNGFDNDVINLNILWTFSSTVIIMALNNRIYNEHGVSIWEMITSTKESTDGVRCRKDIV